MKVTVTPQDRKAKQRREKHSKCCKNRDRIFKIDRTT